MGSPRCKLQTFSQAVDIPQDPCPKGSQPQDRPFPTQQALGQPSPSKAAAERAPDSLRNLFAETFSQFLLHTQWDLPERQAPASINQAAPRSGTSPRDRLLPPSIKQPRALAQWDLPERQAPPSIIHQAALRSGSSPRNRLLLPSIKQPIVAPLVAPGALRRHRRMPVLYVSSFIAVCTVKVTRYNGSFLIWLAGASANVAVPLPYYLLLPLLLRCRASLCSDQALEPSWSLLAAAGCGQCVEQLRARRPP